MWGFLIALLSGALMSIQGVLNTEATKQTGIWVAAGWVQLTAFLTCIVLWFFADKSPIGAILEVRPLVYAVRGTDWRFYNLYCHKKHGRAWSCQGNTFDRGYPDPCSLRN